MLRWKFPFVPRLEAVCTIDRKPIFGLLVALLTVLAQPVAAAPLYPLQKSANGRYFVDQAGVPVLVHGDTPWSLIGELTREEVTDYLDDCAARKFNALIVNAPEAAYTSDPPNNAYGQPPFLIPGRFSTRNEAYYQHADFVVEEAAARGIQILMAPAYLGHPGEGWYDAVHDQNTAQEMRQYGAWIGNRYAGTPNLMFMWGTEPLPFDLVIRDKVRAMAEGLRSVDASHLTTYHSSSEQATYDVWTPSQETWLDFNNIYTYQPVWQSAQRDYGFFPPTPFILLESKYENERGTSGKQQRVQAYHALLSGAAGHFYGNSPIWHMGVAGGNWRAALSDPGRDDMAHVKKLFESRTWHRLVPDFNGTVLTSGHSTGDDRATVARTDDGKTIIVYAPSRRTLRVDMNALSGATATAWWYNPRDGSVDGGTQMASSGSRDFVPPTYDDWVLVIDDYAAGLAPPGTVNLYDGDGSDFVCRLADVGRLPQCTCSVSAPGGSTSPLWLAFLLGLWVALRRRGSGG